MVHKHVLLRGLSVEREGKSAAYKARLEQNRDPGQGCRRGHVAGCLADLTHEFPPYPRITRAVAAAVGTRAGRRRASTATLLQLSRSVTPLSGSLCPPRMHRVFTVYIHAAIARGCAQGAALFICSNTWAHIVRNRLQHCACRAQHFFPGARRISFPRFLHAICLFSCC